jgi:Asp-tRNA(Asn)/Glu-tRNA(Gln) amidotransferase A subunit family amidase
MEQEEQITSEDIEKETSEEGEAQETPEKPERKPLEEMEKEELVRTAKGLYSRLKKERESKTELEDIIETAAKELEESGEFTEKEKEELGKEVAEQDVFGLMKTVSALKDYDPAELDYIALISKAKGIPPEEAAKTEEVELWIQARREKVTKEQQTPEPSSPSGIESKIDVKKVVEQGDEAIAKIAAEATEELLRKEGRSEGV